MDIPSINDYVYIVKTDDKWIISQSKRPTQIVVIKNEVVGGFVGRG